MHTSLRSQRVRAEGSVMRVPVRWSGVGSRRVHGLRSFGVAPSASLLYPTVRNMCVNSKLNSLLQ